ncbi:PadR family transcriptional regulator [Marinilactibacillus kalidii]|uniref:PadR family transcriptional regulator n=1 Tax=Marinilactibacillus kalidii TaxID=2820274 RepID=UPI001ABE6DF2|nr:PadR family transcriptional regulator [Marinilactibacillus kalidii]
MSDEDLHKVYNPMTETAFYILLSLQAERHGYGIMQDVEELTNNRLSFGAGTLYGSLSKLKKDGLIDIVKEEGKRKIYQITPTGKQFLRLEKQRIEELYKNAERIDS